MERDFMGLKNSKDSAVVVKEEPVEGCKDSAFSRGSPVQWPLSNVFDPSVKHQPDENQKNISRDRQGRTHYSMTAYPVQQNTHPVNLSRDVKMLQGSNQAVSVTLTNPFYKNHFAGPVNNFVGAPAKQQLLGGIPVTASPPNRSVAGTTEPWFNSKAPQAPAQLTIFYAGTVNVFDAISPEKAQAIMFLAGNAVSASSIIPQPRTLVQAPAPKSVAEDVGFVNQPMHTPPCSGLSSPISVTSHPVVQSGGGSSNNDGPAKTMGGLSTTVSKVEAPKTMNLGQVVASAVPQARKASLARFLEKRKERAISSAPYNSKKFEECGTPTSSGVGFSATSGVGSGSIPAS